MWLVQLNSCLIANFRKFYRHQQGSIQRPLLGLKARKSIPFTLSRQNLNIINPICLVSIPHGTASQFLVDDEGSGNLPRSHKQCLRRASLSCRSLYHNVNSIWSQQFAWAQTGQFLCEHILTLIKVKNLMRRMKIEYILPHNVFWLGRSKRH